MLNIAIIDPWQRSLFSRQRTPGKGPLLAGNPQFLADEMLTLETSAFESLYGGQFTLSSQLIKPNYLVLLPTDAAPQSL